LTETAEAPVKEAVEHNGRPLGIAPAKKCCIAVLTPTLGQVSMFWHIACLDLVFPMNLGKGFIPMIDMIGGEVGPTRNRLVKMALASAEASGQTLDWIFWIDDDVIFNRMCLLQLIKHNRDIASGVYFSKGETGNQPLIFAGGGCGTMDYKPAQVDGPGETMEAWGWSQGLSLIKTEVYQRMVEELDLGVDKYGTPCWYKEPEFGLDKTGQMIMGGTEDFHFFDNASKLGYRPLIDCTKFTFAYHYDAERRYGCPKKQWDMWLRREPIVWQTKEGEVVWE